MWDYLMKQYHNPVAAAAIMGNAQGESSLHSYRLGNDVDKDENGEYRISMEFTRRVDSGELNRDGFLFPEGVYDSYGLFCWYGNGRKGNLYDFAMARGTSVGDWKMQLDFAYKEIIERYFKLYMLLMTCTDIKTVTDAFTTDFEQAARDDIDSGKRTAFAQNYLNEFWGVKEISLEYKEGDMLPIFQTDLGSLNYEYNQSYEYMDTVLLKADEQKSSIYVYMLQTGLENLGYPVSPDGIVNNGFFGDTLKKCVLDFQNDYGLEITGVFTPADWHVLAKHNGIEGF